MSEPRPKLFLLDAYALIYRAYYAFIRAPRINSSGMNTSATFGFTNTLLDVINNYNPSHLAVVFDLSGPVFRHETFPDYKANREEVPDDIRLAVPYIRKIVEGFNIPILEKEGFEADDIIGTVAHKAADHGFDVYMVTPDKDFGQLVQDGVWILRPGNRGNPNEIWGIEEVKKKFGIQRPEQVIDILALQGDAVDNIPGVPGIGPKTATKLIGTYGSVENLLENTDELKGKMKENVVAHADQAILSKNLATILLDVPVTFDPEALKLTEPNRDELREIFATLEFRTLAERVLGEKVAAPGGAQLDLFGSAEMGVAPVENSGMASYSPETEKYHVIDTKDKRTTFLKKLMAETEVCFDTETDDLDAHSAELVGMSFSWKPGEAYYVPLPENQAGTAFILDEFKPFFDSGKTLKIGHNLKYDLNVLRRYGIEVREPMFDTLLAHYLLNPDMRHNMDMLAEVYLNYRTIPIENLLGKRGKNQATMREVPVKDAAIYACEDADITLRLYKRFKPDIGKEENLSKLFYRLEMPLMPVLSRMESHGVKIDRSALEDISTDLAEVADSLTKEIHQLAGQEFNVASPKQLGIVLFEVLKIGNKPKKTKSGQYATGEETLQKLAGEHEIIGKILEYREVVKLKNTYVDTLPALINPRDNRIHTTYRQSVASTGRLSSQNPNLQNIPIRTTRGKAVRKAFVASDENHTLLAADYSQIELRLMAHLSEDKNMIAAFKGGLDIHAATAARVFGVTVEEVTREMRDRAKMVNFGIIYGISAFGLAQRLDISRTEAAELISNYFEQYPGIKKYMDGSIESAREKGYVETIMGRRRYLPDINSGNATVRGFAERNAINAPIQGSAADMIKVAMIRIDEAMRENNLRSKMILQVHDELVFDALRTEAEKLGSIVEKEMREAIPGLKVPIVVDMNTADNWLEAH
ncbi:MAG TPA: DNA polymerase I [Cryomorphaceae bacterium]|nr:DNA polymerase I [Cryomorphaceae bacterium]